MSNPFQNWSEVQLAAHNARVAARGRSRGLSDTGAPPERVQEGKTQPAAIVEAKKGIRERDLHDQIIEFCNGQWPRWKYLHSRMDRASTVAVGAPDFVIFGTGGRALCVECKKPGSKLTTEQLGWHKEMAMLGWTVEVVFSFEDFMAAVNRLAIARLV